MQSSHQNMIQRDIHLKTMPPNNPFSLTQSVGLPRPEIPYKESEQIYAVDLLWPGWTSLFRTVFRSCVYLAISWAAESS